MTDKQRLIELLNLFGIGFREESSGEVTHIMCETGMPKVTGYSGFCSTFTFNAGTGRFIDMAAEEG